MDTRHQSPCAMGLRYGHLMATEHERKKPSLHRMCEDAKTAGVDVVMIHHPEVLGEDYAEIIESLNCLADANLRLSIVSRSMRGK